MHPSRLPVSLHTTLLPAPLAHGVADRERSRAVSVTVAGRAARALAPADALLHVCALGFCARARRSIQWAVDAHRLVGMHPDLDWAMLLETAHTAGVTVPLAVTLRFLHDELAAAVPRPVLDGLETRDAGRGRAVALPSRCCHCGSRRGAGWPAACRRPPVAWVAASSCGPCARLREGGL